MAPFKSGWTAIAGIELPPDTPVDQDELKKLKGSKSRDNVDKAQQREPLFTGEFERANDLTGAGTEVPPDTPDDQDEEKKLKGSESRDMVDVLKSGWTLLLISLIIEIASAVCDQLRYPLVGMVLAFVALLLSTADLLIHMAPEERTSLLPSFRRPSTNHSHGTKGKKPGGTIVEYFGLVGAVWQCVYSIVAYAYARQKKDNPIKMSLLPLIFFSCVVISKLNEQISEREKDRMKRESGTGAGKEGLHNEKASVDGSIRIPVQENPALEPKKPKDFDNWKNVDKEVKDKKREREADIGGRPEKGSTMSGKESDDGCADGEIATERERGVFNHGVQQPKRMLRSIMSF